MPYQQSVLIGEWTCRVYRFILRQGDDAQIGQLCDHTPHPKRTQEQSCTNVVRKQLGIHSHRVGATVLGIAAPHRVIYFTARQLYDDN